MVSAATGAVKVVARVVAAVVVMTVMGVTGAVANVVVVVVGVGVGVGVVKTLRVLVVAGAEVGSVNCGGLVGGRL